MKLWLVTVGEPLPLAGETARLWRTGLLARMLAERGHQVLWWTSSVDHFNKRHFVQGDVRLSVSQRLELQFLHGRLYHRNISLARVLNHRQLGRAFRRLSAAERVPDLILASYPTIELSLEAARYGVRRQVPVVLDIRDLWPQEIAARLPGALRPAAQLLLWPLYREARLALRQASGLIGISDEYLRWGLRLAKRARTPADATFTHGYPARPHVSEERAAAARTALGIGPATRIAWFAGTFVASIDLGTVIEAARQLQDLKDLVFVLSGSGERDAEWRAQAGGLPNVIFTGWLDAETLSALGSTAWLGLGAYKRGALMSLTNKIFEYMAHGLPVLLSLPGEARALIEREGCGVFYEPGSAASLAGSLRRLHADPAARDEMARRASQAFERQYRAETVYGRMIEHLEHLAQPRQ